MYGQERRCDWRAWSLCLVCLLCVVGVHGVPRRCAWCAWSVCLVCLVGVPAVPGRCACCAWSACLVCLVCQCMHDTHARTQICQSTSPSIPLDPPLNAMFPVFAYDPLTCLAQAAHASPVACHWLTPMNSILAESLNHASAKKGLNAWPATARPQPFAGNLSLVEVSLLFHQSFAHSY